MALVTSSLHFLRTLDDHDPNTIFMYFVFVYLPRELSCRNSGGSGTSRTAVFDGMSLVSSSLRFLRTFDDIITQPTALRCLVNLWYRQRSVQQVKAATLILLVYWINLRSIGVDIGQVLDGHAYKCSQGHNHANPPQKNQDQCQAILTYKKLPWSISSLNGIKTSFFLWDTKGNPKEDASSIYVLYPITVKDLVILAACTLLLVNLVVKRKP